MSQRELLQRIIPSLYMYIMEVKAERLVTDKRGQVVEWSLLRISYAYVTDML